MQYFGGTGQRTYEAHRKNSRPSLKLAQVYDFVAYAEQQILEEKLVPETICGAARHSGKLKVIVCVKTLYSYIDQRLLKV